MEIFMTSYLEYFFKQADEFGKFPASRGHTIISDFHKNSSVYYGSGFVVSSGMLSGSG